MNNLTITNLLLALLGITIHLLLKVIGRKNKATTFSLAKFINENALYTFTSILCTLAIIILADDVFAMLSIEPNLVSMEFYSFTAGYLNQSLLRNVLKIFKTKTENP